MKEEKVLVVVLGWMGGHRKHVQKYADWWASFGCDTIISCSTAVSTFYPPGTKKVARNLVKQLQEYVDINPNCTIIFHAFSNGGGFVLAQILHLLEEKKYAQIRNNVKFNVLDSLLDVYILSAIRAFHALHLPIYMNLVFYIVFPIILIYTFFTNYFHTNLAGYTLRKIPTHVLYSTSDTICHPHEIETFISHLHSHSIPTTSHKFHGSPHVSHFRAYPEEYSRSVLEFVAAHGLNLKAKEKREERKEIEADR